MSLRGGMGHTGSMPDNSAEYHGLTVARYHRWVQGLTLKQYVLFTGVVNFAAAAVVGAVISAISGPFSWSLVWSWVAVWTVLMTAFLTWWQRGSVRQAKEHPAEPVEPPPASHPDTS
jgi:hypothetical protein